MSEVKRYEVDHKGIFLEGNGRFVLHEDYAELQQKLDAALAEREKFAVQCAAARIAVQYARAAGFECTLNTPAIDAYLNEVRAQGLDMLASQLNGYAENHVYSHTKRHAEDFAAQLRAGEVKTNG